MGARKLAMLSIPKKKPKAPPPKVKIVRKPAKKPTKKDSGWKLVPQIPEPARSAPEPVSPVPPYVPADSVPVVLVRGKRGPVPPVPDLKPKTPPAGTLPIRFTGGRMEISYKCRVRVYHDPRDGTVTIEEYKMNYPEMEDPS
jgi:hypothetical protein